MLKHIQQNQPLLTQLIYLVIMLTDDEVSLPHLDAVHEDMSRSQSPMIPLTIENTLLDIKTEPRDCVSPLEDDDEEDFLNSSLTPMDWLPKLNAKAGVVEEEIPEEEKKPPYSYASLIRLAILNTSSQKATLADIYAWIQDQFLYYKNQINPGWKNSIRHNLSLNKSFMKVARSRQDPGKGCYWAINHLHQHDKQTSFEKKKKNFLLPNELGCTDSQLASQSSIIQTLQKNFVEQLQQQQSKQLQQLLAEQLAGLQAQKEAEHFVHFHSQLAAQQGTLPLLLPISQQSHTLDEKASTNSQSNSTMLLDDWATSSEADLSQSLSRYVETQYTKVDSHVSAEDASSLPMITSNQATSLLGPGQTLFPRPEGGPSIGNLDTFNNLELWPELKTEAWSSSMYKYVNPIDDLSQTEAANVSPSEILGMTEPGKLPSLWAGLGRMSWLGYGERAVPEWLEMGRIRQVPEQEDAEDDLIDIDYDQLL